MTRDMQDNLEKFIKDHKDEFDDLSPSESVWKGINKELTADKKSSNQMFIWKAAAIFLFVFSIGLTVFVNRDILGRSETVAVFDNEFINTENYYTSMITSRQQLVKQVAQMYPDIENDFEMDWEDLDRNYVNLKKEYRQNQSQEVRNALVQNLRARVNLLNRQIEVLERIEKKEINIVEI